MIKSISKLWIMHTYNDEKREFESYDYRAFQSIWLYSWIKFWKKGDSKVKFCTW
jgi:hypothetical protein